MAPKLLDDWAVILHQQFPEASDAEIWRTVCRLLLSLVHPATGTINGGSPEGVSAVDQALR
jgi:hypothetical protein